jgi:hypothetical protein
MQTRAMLVGAAALLAIAIATNHWLSDYGDGWGLLGFSPIGRAFIWHTEWIRVAREMNESIAKPAAFAASGIATFVASGLAALALLICAVRPGLWLRRIVWILVILAAASIAVFNVATPMKVTMSWSLALFVAGATLAYFGLKRRPA